MKCKNTCKQRPLLIACLLLLVFFSMVRSYSQQLPVGYISYYAQKGNNTDLMNSLVANVPSGFTLSKDNISTQLNPKQADTTNPDLPPSCRGIIADIIFGEFIIDFDYKLQPGITKDAAGFYFLCPVKSENTYYAIAFSDDSCKFFFADRGSILNIDFASGFKVNTGWNKVRIERNILTRSLLITLNGDTNHRAIFSDPALVMGYIGFGTHDIISNLRNVSIWAPTAFTDTLYVP